MSNIREEFEEFWNSPAQWELRKSCARGWAEKIWRESRAAQKVDLPEQHDAKHPGSLGFNACLRRVKEALQQAGIEVK